MQSSAQVLWYASSSGRDLHRYHQHGVCSHALKDMAVPMRLCRLFAAHSLQLRAMSASHWLSFLQCTWHCDRTRSLKNDVVVAFFWKSLFYSVVGSSLAATAPMLGFS